MKQKMTLLLLSLLAVLPLYADGLWGARAALDINVPGKWHVGDMSHKNYHSGLGFSAGGVYTHYFTDNFFLEPSLSLFYDTYKEEMIIDFSNESESDPTVYKVGLRLPLVVGYTFDFDAFSLSVFIGPELNYAFAGGYRFHNNHLQDEYFGIFGKDAGHQRHFTCAWKAGVGFPFSDWRVDLETSLGLTDMIKGPASCKENRVSISLLRYF